LFLIKGYVLKTTIFHRMESFYLDHGAPTLHWTKYIDNGMFNFVWVCFRRRTSFRPQHV